MILVMKHQLTKKPRSHKPRKFGHFKQAKFSDYLQFYDFRYFICHMNLFTMLKVF
jgi:hypothetical protein